MFGTRKSQVGQITRCEKSTFLWKIPKFSRYNVSELTLIAPLFSTSTLSEGFKWQLALNSVNYSSINTREFLNLHFECLSNDIHMATISAGIVKNNGTILTEKTNEYEKDDVTMTFYKFGELGFLKDPANEILDGDVLTIRCNILMGKNKPLRVLGTSSIKNKSSDKKNKLNPQLTLRLEEFDDFESMLNDPHFSDVTIKVEDKRIMAHKLILAKRSPVFAAMFRTDMKEHLNNVVQVTDIKYDVFMEMLRFVYSGKVRQLEAIAVDLLVAADKYQMANLKHLCEIELLKQLSVEDAVPILKLAEKHRAERLKKAVIDFIVENRIDIFDQAEFRGVGTELMFEICQAMK